MSVVATVARLSCCWALVSIIMWYSSSSPPYSRSHLLAGQCPGTQGAWNDQLFPHNFSKCWAILEILSKQTQLYICNNVLIKRPTAPISCCYSMLWWISQGRVAKHLRYSRLLEIYCYTSGYATMVHGRGCNPHRCTTTFANVEITSLWRHWWRHNSETIRDRQKRRPPCTMKSSELSNGEKPHHSTTTFAKPEITSFMTS